MLSPACRLAAAAILLSNLGTVEGESLNVYSVKRGGGTLAQRQENQISPAPVVAKVSQFWEGNDGPWSSFVIQVGNSSQEVRVLPSTASSSTWVIYADPGCNDVPVADCPASRGKTFQRGMSRSWDPASLGPTAFFELGIEENLLGRQVYGDYGWDIISLGWPGSKGPTVNHSVVAGIGDTHFTWLGVLGLNPLPINFENMKNEPQASFIQSLKNQGDIPSLSWAYTAGAPYQLNSVYGSLVLGGYDEARFTKPSDTNPGLTFPFHEDVARDLLVGVSSITTSNTTSSASETMLLKEGIYAFIDSTVTHLWLPMSACEAFESAFGLTWDPKTELYTLNSTQHSNLLKLNPSITFSLSPVLTPESEHKTVSIALPYSAFNLNVSWPFGGGQYANESTYYFPLKRAANETQYTLGRTFLQEAYLIADYERHNFSVWPCKWDSNTTTAQVVSIPGVTIKNDSSTRKLDAGAIAGIIIGSITGAIIIGLAIIFYMRRRRATQSSSIQLDIAQDSNSGSSLHAYHQHKVPSIAELASPTKYELPEVHRVEAPVGGKFEMDGEGLPHEFDASEKNQLHEMDAGCDGIGGMHGVRITVEPPTALSPQPSSMMPSPVSTKSTMVNGQDMKDNSGDNSREKESMMHARSAAYNEEKDGVRSFFGFLKAFRKSGES